MIMSKSSKDEDDAKADGVSVGEEEGDVMSSSVTAMIADKSSEQIESLIHQLEDEQERLPPSDVNKEGRIQSKIDQLVIILSSKNHHAFISA